MTDQEKIIQKHVKESIIEAKVRLGLLNELSETNRRQFLEQLAKANGSLNFAIENIVTK